MMSNPTIYVNTVLPVNEDTLIVNWEYREEACDSLPTVNVVYDPLCICCTDVTYSDVQSLNENDAECNIFRFRVQEWVNNSEENRSIRNKSNIQPSITKAQVQGLQGKPRENEDPPGEPSHDFIQPGENRSNEINISQVNVGNTQSNDVQL
ncbi:hypothetical protein JTB14_010427 [Gonioctena quinquepunctata]|nr:hypothetical protein JTB14_010427 [Gonioctena quinquepunctata]